MKQEPANQPEAPQSPMAANPKLMGFLTEASKFTVLAAFILYAIGFIIWHSYLAKYGTVPVEFLRSEYFSAALCYVLYLIVFSLPMLVLAVNLHRRIHSPPNAPKDAFYVVIVAPFVLLWVLTNLVLPARNYVLPLTLRWIQFGIAVTVAFLVVALEICIRKVNKGRTTLCDGKVNLLKLCKLTTSTRIMYTGISLFYLVSIPANPAFNALFIGFTVMLPLFLTVMWGIDLRETFPISSGWLKTLMLTYCTVMLILHVQQFGAKQFELIPKSIGGGHPETAYIQLSPSHSDLIAVLQLPTTNAPFSTNVLIGPLAILLRSEKDFIFVNASDLNAPATITNIIATNRIETIRKPLTNGTFQFFTNCVPSVTNVVKNRGKVYARQIRTELIEAIRFSD